MNTNCPNDASSDEPLIRFDLRGQFAMNRVIRQVKELVKPELEALNCTTVAPYLHNRGSRSFQCFAVHDTAIKQLDDQHQTVRMGKLRSLLEGEKVNNRQFTRQQWDDYWGAIDAKKPETEKWLETYQRLSYKEWLNYYFRYCARQSELLNGMLWDLFGARTGSTSALGGLLVQIEDAGVNPDRSRTKHRKVWTINIGDQKPIPLEGGLYQNRSGGRSDLEIHSALVDIFAYADTVTPRNLSHVLILPIYEHYLNKVPLGGITATLQIPMLFLNRDVQREPNNTEELAISCLVHKLQSCVEIIANDLATSARQRAVVTPPGAPLSLTHEWIGGIQLLQDWEEIRIERIGKTSLFWKRRPTNTKGVFDEQGLFSTLILTSEQDDFKPHSKDELTGSNPSPVIVIEVKGEDSDRYHYVQGIEDAMRIDDGSTVGRLANLQDIKSITFQFPSYFRLPKAADRQWQELCDSIVRQQKELLQVLEPKVLARKSAVRTAVSAIMGRNMSHNIGSHVIARYAGKAALDVKSPTSDEADHRGDFLAYLQRRMDFLAEIATSDQTFWSQPLPLQDQVGRLNYARQLKRFNNTPEPRQCPVDANCGHYLSPKKVNHASNVTPIFSKLPILLSFITGKESLHASVEYGLPHEICNKPDQAPSGCCLGHKPKWQDDYWFACPSGEVGVHALYVVLENVIRNSARHGGSGDDTVRIFVHVPDQQDEFEDLLCVELIDPRTKLHSDGREIRDDGSNDSSRKTTAEEEAEELKRRNAKSLFDSGGNRKNLTSLTGNINSILSDEPFLDASGSPNSKYWGVREMQICSHYLRGYSLADLEGEKHNPPVLEAYVHPLGSESYCLKYKLYLRRAKFLAAVVKDALQWEKKGIDLRSKGVAVFQLSGKENEDPWVDISKAASGYSFLLVEEEDVIGAIPEIHKTYLPVRRLTQNAVQISNLIERAGQDYSWTEPLHKLWAEQCRDLRPIWDGKDMYGVVVGANTLQQPSPEGLPTLPPNGGGLFWVEKSPSSNVCPLPERVEHWHSKLEGNCIAAAWVDHAGPPDFDREFYGRLGHAAIQLVETDNEDMTQRVWISAEGAFSDSAHTATLSNCRAECGWELLAASVPRVAVLDERVQSELARDARSGLLLSEMWPLMGVWVPTKQVPYAGNRVPHCNLDVPDFNEIQEFLRNPAPKTQYPIDFLVIHLTILERLSKRFENLESALKTLIVGTQAEHAEIIVVTGRGVPNIARQKSNGRVDAVRFLPISALLEALVSRPSKLALMRAIWSACKPNSANP